MAHILVVDDEISLVDALAEILADAGHSVTTETSGGGAMGFLADHHDTLPDLILCDVRMDGMSGIELVRQVRNQPVLKHIPILLMSASAYPGTTNPAADQENVLYIRKPFEIDDLLEMVLQAAALGHRT